MRHAPIRLLAALAAIAFANAPHVNLPVVSGHDRPLLATGRGTAKVKRAAAKVRNKKHRNKAKHHG
ncbi:hypothetical protein HQN60_12595 [Deefgea piscis]|uniref:Uncharacterized protein n=1 Tax=Deefgea piscis TaxID=2739061 RepID=A0A6M8SV73_9NEIS|nr:hypothetical protein [Deefgea piscis]QKJ67476.1 hypothetical protein HQN60_12595 [Deefgea piscis]